VGDEEMLRPVHKKIERQKPNTNNGGGKKNGKEPSKNEEELRLEDLGT